MSPVRPISAPSLDAMRAMENPAPGPWLYFVTTNPDTGQTKFATTYNLNDSLPQFQALVESLLSEPAANTVFITISNDGDLPSMILLPELMHRRHFGRADPGARQERRIRRDTIHITGRQRGRDLLNVGTVNIDSHPACILSNSPLQASIVHGVAPNAKSAILQVESITRRQHE